MPDYIRRWDDETLITNTIDYPAMLVRLPWCPKRADVAAKCSMKHKHPVLFYRVMFHSTDHKVHGADPFRPLYGINTSVLNDGYWPFHVPLCEYALRATLVSCVEILDVEDGHTQSFYLLPHTDINNPYRTENTTRVVLNTVVEGADKEKMEIEEEELINLADIAAQHLDAAADKQIYDSYKSVKASYRIDDVRTTENGCLIWLSALHWNVVRRMMTVYIPEIDTDRSLITGLLPLFARAYFASGFHEATYTPLTICSMRTREGTTVASKRCLDAENTYAHAFLQQLNSMDGSDCLWTIYATTVIAAFIGENEDVMKYLDCSQQKIACDTPIMQFEPIHSNVVRNFRDDLSMRVLFELEKCNMPNFAKAWQPLRSNDDQMFHNQQKTHIVVELFPTDPSRPYARSMRLRQDTIHLELVLSDNGSSCDIISTDVKYLLSKGILRECRTASWNEGDRLNVHSYLKKSCVMFYPLDPKDPNCHIVLIHNSLPSIACVIHKITRNQTYGADMECLITNGCLFSKSGVSSWKM